MKVKVLVTQSCPTLCDPMDCNPLRSSVHGISQTRILEWVAIPFSRGSSYPGTNAGLPVSRAISLASDHQEKKTVSSPIGAGKAE